MEPEKESKLCDEYDFNLNMHSGIRMKLVHSKPHFGVHTGFESKWPQKDFFERVKKTTERLSSNWHFQDFTKKNNLFIIHWLNKVNMMTRLLLLKVTF